MTTCLHFLKETVHDSINHSQENILPIVSHRNNSSFDELQVKVTLSLFIVEKIDALAKES